MAGNELVRPEQRRRIHERRRLRAAIGLDMTAILQADAWHLPLAVGEPREGLLALAHDHDVDAEVLGRPRGHLHLLGRPLPDALGVTVAPDARGEDVLVPGVDRVVADGLTLEVVGDREQLQAVLLEGVQLGLDVGVVLGRLPRVEVVAPAGDLQPVVAPAGGQLADLLERQVGPLAGEQGDRSCHLKPFQGWWGPAPARRAGHGRRSRRSGPA